MSVLNRVLYDSATILIHLVLAMTVLGLLLALGFFYFHEDVWEPPQLDLSVDELTSRPEAYDGERVVVRGHVEAVLSDRTFLLSGDDHLGTGASVLAVSARPLRYVLAPGGRFDAGAMVGRPAQVVGSVHRLDAEAVRREMGVELEASDRQANLVLYISATEMLPAAEILPQHVTPVEPAVLGENIDEYMGRGVVVEGRITERVGSVAVVLDDALLVMTRVPLGRDAVPGEEVTARGSARRFDIGELEHMIAIDLEERVFERFRTKPVVLALEIERS